MKFSDLKLIAGKADILAMRSVAHKDVSPHDSYSSQIKNMQVLFSSGQVEEKIGRKLILNFFLHLIFI